MPSITLLAIWSVVSDFAPERKAAFTQALLRAQDGNRSNEPAAFSGLIVRALALSSDDRRALVELLVGAIEAEQG